MSKDNKLTKTNDGYVVELFAKVKKEINEEIIDVSEGICLLDIIPNKTEEEQFLIYKEIIETISKKIGGYVLAQIVTMSSVGVIMAIGLLLIKVDYAILLTDRYKENREFLF